MEEFGVFISQFNPLNSPSLFPINFLLVKEIIEFLLESLYEVPLKESEISIFFNNVGKKIMLLTLEMFVF